MCVSLSPNSPGMGMCEVALSPAVSEGRPPAHRTSLLLYYSVPQFPHRAAEVGGKLRPARRSLRVPRVSGCTTQPREGKLAAGAGGGGLISRRR